MVCNNLRYTSAFALGAIATCLAISCNTGMYYYDIQNTDDYSPDPDVDHWNAVDFELVECDTGVTTCHTFGFLMMNMPISGVDIDTTAGYYLVGGGCGTSWGDWLLECKVDACNCYQEGHFTEETICGITTIVCICIY